MGIEITCGKCKRRYTAPDKAAGRKIACPQCKAAIDVPEVVAELEAIDAPAGSEELQILGESTSGEELELLGPAGAPADLEMLPQPGVGPLGPAVSLPAAPGPGVPQAPLNAPSKPGGEGINWVLWSAVGGGALVVVGLLVGVLVMAFGRSSPSGDAVQQPVASNAPAPPSTPTPSVPAPSTPAPPSPGTGISPPVPGPGPSPPSTTPTGVRPPPRPAPGSPPAEGPKVQTQPARVWAFQPDPAPAIPPVDPAKKIAIPVGPTPTAEVIFPSRPSRFVAIGSNRSVDDYREVWDLAAGTPGERIGGLMKDASHFALSPDGKHLAALTYPEGRGREGTIEVRAAESGKQVGSLPFADAHRLRWLDFAAPGQLLAARDAAGHAEVIVWSIADKQPLRQFTVSESSCSAEQFALSPGGKCLAVVDRDIKVFDLAGGRAVLDVPMPTVVGMAHGSVQAVAFSPDSRFLAFLANSQPSWSLFCLHLAQESPPDVRLIGPPWSDRLRAAADDCPAPRLEWLPDDGGWLAFGSIVLERQTGQGLWEFPKAARQKSPRRVLDAKRLLAVTRREGSRVLECLEIPGEKIRIAADVARKGGDPIDVRIGATADVDRSAEKAISLPRGEQPAWAVQADPAPPAGEKHHEGSISIAGDLQQTRFSRPDAGQAVLLVSQKQDARPPIGHFPGSANAAPSAPRWLERVDLFTGKPSGRVDLPVPGDLLDVSPSGRLALVRFVGQRIDVYSLEDGKRLCGFRPWQAPAGDKNAPRTWGWFLDDTHVLSLAGPGPSELVLWEVPKCRATYAVALPKESRGAMTPGRKYIAVLDEGRIAFLEAATGEVKGCLPLPAGVGLLPWDPGQAAFSPDGSRLAVTSGAGGASELLAWDLSTGQLTADAPDVAGGENLQWCGPKHVLVAQGPAGVLVDLERVAVVWRYRFNGGSPVGQSPDGRPWHNVAPFPRQPSCFGATAIVDEKVFSTVDTQVAKGQTRLWGPGTPILVDAGGLNVASPELKAKLDAAVQRSVQASGFALGQGQGMRLQVTCAMIDSRTVEYQTFSGGRRTISVKVPRANVRAALTDGAQVLWERATEVSGGVSGIMEFIPGNQDPQAYLENQVYTTQTAAMENFFGSLRLPRAGYAKLRDAAGQPGLGETALDLAQRFDLRPDASAAAGGFKTPGDLGAGFDPEADQGFAPGRGRQEESPLADEAFERAARDYVGTTAAGVIAAEDAEVAQRVRWFPAGKRPVFGLRWGVGVQFSGAESPRVRDLHDLERLTGPAGPAIGMALQNHVTMNEFGKWPPGGDSRLRQVAFLGLGKQETLIEAAQRQAIDVIVVLNVQARASGSGKRLDNLVRARFVDVGSGKTLWASEPIAASSSGRRGSGAAADRAVEQVFKRLDDDFCLKPMPEITAEQAKKRLASLGLPEAKPANPVAALVEIRFYQAKQLLTAAEAAPNYEAILGKGKGRLLATGDRAQRRGLAQEWIEGQEKQGPASP